MDHPVDAPQMTELDQLGLQRGDGVSNLDCQEVWCCPNCRVVYPPTRNLLVNLPAFGCFTCQIQNPTAYGWKIPQTIVNGVSLDFMVYDQGSTNHCVMYASVAAMDCARRIRGAMHGVSKCAPFDMKEVLIAYEKKTGYKCGLEPRNLTYHGDSFPLVLTFLKHHGVPYIPRMTGTSVRFLKLKNYFLVRNYCKGENININFVTKLLANGYPLLVGVDVGALFRFVNNMEVYNPPVRERGCFGHALALIGSGIGRNKNGVLETYFVVRDSSGGRGHSDYSKQGFGGDMLIWSSDVYNIWGFYLEDE